MRSFHANKPGRGAGRWARRGRRVFRNDHHSCPVCPANRLKQGPLLCWLRNLYRAIAYIHSHDQAGCPWRHPPAADKVGYKLQRRRGVFHRCFLTLDQGRIGRQARVHNQHKGSHRGSEKCRCPVSRVLGAGTAPPVEGAAGRASEPVTRAKEKPEIKLWPPCSRAPAHAGPSGREPEPQPRGTHLLLDTGLQAPAREGDLPEAGARSPGKRGMAAVRATPRELVAELLRSTTCYDALPHSGKVSVAWVVQRTGLLPPAARLGAGARSCSTGDAIPCAPSRMLAVGLAGTACTRTSACAPDYLPARLCPCQTRLVGRVFSRLPTLLPCRLPARR